MSVRHKALPSVLVGLVMGASLGGGAQNKTDVQRAIYLTATDRTGAHVSDLTPADLTVREGGRDRQLLTLQPSTARLKISIAIAERISTSVNAIKVSLNGNVLPDACCAVRRQPGNEEARKTLVSKGFNEVIGL